MSDGVLPPHLASAAKKALERVDLLYHTEMKHILGASSQRQYEDATASLRGVLSQEAPPLALADFDSDMLRTTFGVTRHPSIGEMLQVERAERVSLSRIHSFSKSTPQRRADQTKQTSSSNRLYTILELTLTETQRFNVVAATSPLNPPPHMDALRWSMQSPISMSLTYEGRQRRLNGVLDYMLLWGARQHSETNLVVVAGKSRGAASLAREEALVAMSMIHAVRKVSGKRNCRMFGLGTDSYDFYFIGIENDSVYSYRLLEWWVADDKRDIVSLLGKIMLIPTGHMGGRVSIGGG
ncbi:hypothetical protein BJX66DRAFT_333660 [Aspergillus keveii]|uniref:Uncharacterized protein n=1 Tax=Aspergillus keveii TaxID=714993 RepID=A0ABR4GIV1_9EURO